MDKQRLQLGSAHQIGIGNTSHDFSDCSGELQKGGEVWLAEFLLLTSFQRFTYNSATISLANK